MSIRRKTFGFTMLELLVTLAIAAIIVTMGVPSFKTTIQNQRMTAATNELVMSLNLAKSEAIKRVQYVTVCKSDDSISCTGGGTSWSDGWLVFANSTIGNLDTIDKDDEIIGFYRALSEKLSLTPSGTVTSFISFRPTGTMGTSVANLSGTLTTCDERGAAYATGVVMEPSGRWQVSRDKDHDAAALTCP